METWGSKEGNGNGGVREYHTEQIREASQLFSILWKCTAMDIGYIVYCLVMKWY